MPRNRDKAPCQIPGCRNWAMRGHAHCRSHRDRELGPRGGGAPPGNLNALKTGDHTHPLPLSELRPLADQLVRQPDQLPDLLDPIVRSIHSRIRDPQKALVALQTTLADFRQQVAVALFKTEVDTLLRRLPPSQRGRLLRTLKEQAGPWVSEATILSLRRLMVEFEKNSKTSTGTGAHLIPDDLAAVLRSAYDVGES
jgi:hypothetical protein